MRPPEGAEPAIEFAGGEQQKTLEGAGEVLGADGRLPESGATTRWPRSAAVSSATSPASAPPSTSAALPVVQIPTTLVAQVDSALGGKTGVDLPAAKNYVGAYHQPTAVLADPAALASLPDAELAAGYAEVVKTALIAGGALWERVRTGGAPTVALMSEVVFDCALTKICVVAEDERDGGRRNVLNLGPHRRPCDRGGHGLQPLPPRRGGGARAARRAPPLRPRGSSGTRSPACSRRRACRSSIDPEIDLDAVVAATGVDKKRTAEGLGFVLVRASRRRRPRPAGRRR